MISNLPTVSVVIPTYLREQLLCNTINQVLQQDYPHFELIVVDQTPLHSDETQCFLESNLSRFHLIKQNEPSLPLARNTGVYHANGELILFLDDDVVIEPDLIRNHTFNYQDPKVGGVSGRIIEKWLPEIATENVGRVTVAGKIIANRNSITRTESQWASGGNCSFRKDLIIEAGGFDTSFVGNAIFEDVDFSFRLRRLGYIIVYDPIAKIVHLAAGTGGCQTRAGERVDYYYWFIRNKAKFIRKNLPLSTLILMIPLSVARAVKVGLIDNRQPRDFFRLIGAIVDGLKPTRVSE